MQPQWRRRLVGQGLPSSELGVAGPRRACRSVPVARAAGYEHRAPTSTVPMTGSGSRVGVSGRYDSTLQRHLCAGIDRPEGAARANRAASRCVNSRGSSPGRGAVSPRRLALRVPSATASRDAACAHDHHSRVRVDLADQSRRWCTDDRAHQRDASQTDTSAMPPRRGWPNSSSARWPRFTRSPDRHARASNAGFRCPIRARSSG